MEQSSTYPLSSLAASSRVLHLQHVGEPLHLIDSKRDLHRLEITMEDPHPMPQDTEGIYLQEEEDIDPLHRLGEVVHQEDMGMVLVQGIVIRMPTDHGHTHVLGHDLDRSHLGRGRAPRRDGIQDTDVGIVHHRQEGEDGGGVPVTRAFLATAIGVGAEVGIGIDVEDEIQMARIGPANHASQVVVSYLESELCRKVSRSLQQKRLGPPPEKVQKEGIKITNSWYLPASGLSKRRQSLKRLRGTRGCSHGKWQQTDLESLTNHSNTNTQVCWGRTLSLPAIQRRMRSTIM